MSEQLKVQLQRKIDLKTKPQGSLGKLEDIALKIGLVQQSLSPKLEKPTLLVFAGDHGLVDEGVSAFPKEVTHQMVLNYLNGGAAVNVFCRLNNINLKVIDAGVDFDFEDHPDLIKAKIAYGTKSCLKEPAMTPKQCQEAMQQGRAFVEKEHQAGCNIISFGEMGIGNTSAAALIMHKITGYSIEDCTGQGTGHNTEGMKRKLSIVTKVSELYDPKTPEAILSIYGGFEIAMMCGAMLEAKAKGMVILVDGFIVTSALMVAQAIDKSMIDNAIFCHTSHEKGHRLMHDYLGVTGLVDLGMRLGEGTGVAVAYPLVEAALAFLNDMASFEDAGVSNAG